MQVNPLTLPSLPLTEKQNLPGLPAIYFALGNSDEILYIGRSKNLAARWNVHHRYTELKTIGNVRIAWLHCSDESLLSQIEEALIKSFVPPLNRTPNPNPKITPKNEKTEKLIEVVKLARGDLSQRAFGKLLGVSSTAVQLWEKGQSIPDRENLTQIAIRAGFTLEELICHLDGKPMREPMDTNDMLKNIQCMPLSDLAVIVRAGMERLAAAAVASGKYG
ncbi:helix-turn-helix domain-containing protein [Microcoleus anatoxicus]|uniref:Helix-turn-helix domain-containing protein n=1 Tax=Microcoleus anatoxicus PTRS2 TaxID=2705321 RepID=A0ABU8YUU6_9CYAN